MTRRILIASVRWTLKQAVSTLVLELAAHIQNTSRPACNEANAMSMGGGGSCLHSGCGKYAQSNGLCCSHGDAKKNPQLKRYECRFFQFECPVIR